MSCFFTTLGILVGGLAVVAAFISVGIFIVVEAEKAYGEGAGMGAFLAYMFLILVPLLAWVICLGGGIS
jgi:hypothetical protein